jgi:exopolysaccharide biosynthesis protein
MANSVTETELMRPCLLLLLLSLTACAPLSTASAPLPAGAFPAGADVRSETLTRGVTHTTVVDPAGPWTIHVVEVAVGECRPVLEARKPTGRLSTLARTTQLAGDALVAINADFFRAPGGTPVGSHVHAGVPAAGPTEWPLLGIAADGRWAYGRGSLRATVAVRDDAAAVTQINREATSFTAYQGTTAGVALHTARADTLPADSAAWRIVLRVLDGDEGRGRGIVLSVDSPAVRTHLAAGNAALFVRAGAFDWGRRRATGDTVAWRAEVVVDDGTGHAIVAHEAVGGFPALLVGGRDVLGLQTVRRAFGDARHPRTAVGWNADASRLMFVVVDGRQQHSDGMSLSELVTLFRRLGATEAINLDGGGSTALVIRGQLVNRPSDAAGERAVGNALAIAHCSGG